MGLLLRHPDERQRIENGFTFDFQLPGEIVDSNLAHPAFLVLRVVCLSLHRSLTESASCTRTPSKISARAMTIQLFRERSPLSARALRFLLRRPWHPPLPQEPPI